MKSFIISNDAMTNRPWPKDILHSDVNMIDMTKSRYDVLTLKRINKSNKKGDHFERNKGIYVYSIQRLILNMSLYPFSVNRVGQHNIWP